ncbi:uncharacterized protein SPAPADRAFT_62865 [Spathaspora passalidarum NRRL Y-27907]|uniref:RGS domain-containing protein n=1 Tax=Spathaspora passalidarum (strain NRRL Y-27907 / 11-Y1) TaxID=619300 RepID=G3ATJ5_SPAPN|nr:uncharacterized protein SPAPADRAFT_62865 [Spathaspora passalidarum NRRL Y-27907]EGW30958.1 hypothetical protein SPAPADRAFT_62865 [Spathaspora passalidarum NRRL Y-27907]
MEMANTLMRSSSMSNGTTQTSRTSSSTIMADTSSSKSSITTCTPVPTKPYNNINSYPVSVVPTPSTTPVQACPPLDELVNDCFLDSIGQLEDPVKVAFVKKFNDYLIKQHCQENLHFLIDIFNYELYYNKIFPDSNTYNADKERLNSAPNASLLGYITSNTSSVDSLLKVKRDSISTTISKRYSITSTDDLDPQEMFVSTIDDLDANEYAQFNVNIWEEFGQRQIEDEDDEDSSQYVGDDATFTEDEEVEALNSRWHYIMHTYIKHESIQQINISQKLFKEIVEESSHSGVHNPLTLIKARNETLRMLKENGYLSFVSHCKRERASSNQPSPTVSTLPNSPSSLSLEGSPGNTIAKPKSIPRATSPLQSSINNSNSSLSHSSSLISKLSSLPKRNRGPLFSSASSDEYQAPTPSSINNILSHLKLSETTTTNNNSVASTSSRNVDSASSSKRQSRSTTPKISSSNGTNSPSSGKEDSSSLSFKFWSRRK